MSAPPLGAGRYGVTVLEVSYQAGSHHCFGVVLLGVSESDNPEHPVGSLARFVWSRGGFDYPELDGRVGDALALHVAEVGTPSGPYLSHTFTEV